MRKEFLVNALAGYDGNKGMVRTWVRTEPHIYQLQQFIAKIESEELSDEMLSDLVDILLSYTTLTVSASSKLFIDIAAQFGGYDALNKIKESGIQEKDRKQTYIAFLEAFTKEAPALAATLIQLPQYPQVLRELSNVTPTDPHRLIKLEAMIRMTQLGNPHITLYDSLAAAAQEVLIAKIHLMEFWLENMKMPLPDEKLSFIINEVKNHRILNMLQCLKNAQPNLGLLSDEILFLFDTKNANKANAIYTSHCSTPNIFIKKLQAKIQSLAKQNTAKPAAPAEAKETTATVASSEGQETECEVHRSEPIPITAHRRNSVFKLPQEKISLPSPVSSSRSPESKTEKTEEQQTESMVSCASSASPPQ